MSAVCKSKPDPQKGFSLLQVMVSLEVYKHLSLLSSAGQQPSRVSLTAAAAAALLFEVYVHRKWMRLLYGIDYSKLLLHFGVYVHLELSDSQPVS